MVDTLSEAMALACVSGMLEAMEIDPDEVRDDGLVEVAKMRFREFAGELADEMSCEFFGGGKN